MPSRLPLCVVMRRDEVYGYKHVHLQVDEVAPLRFAHLGTNLEQENPVLL